MRRGIGVILMVGVFHLLADDLPRGVVQLSNIKKKMAQNLSRIPNYTCLETITREQQVPGRKPSARKPVPFHLIDVVRLEVAEISGDELFSRPGENKFEKRGLSDLVSGGLMGNGTFSGFAHDVFTSGIPKFQFAGEASLDGRTLLKYDFQVSQVFSGYRVGTDVGHAIVGYHGSFWADPETFDAVRLEVFADDIPAYTGLFAVVNQVEYSQVRIGSKQVLLPQRADMTSRMLEGVVSRNQVVFTHCQQYGVESLISFTPNSDPVPPKIEEAVGQVQLPPDLPLQIALKTPVDSSTAKVGNLIRGTVEVEVKRKGEVMVPKDAVVSGRVRRLEQHLEGWPYVLMEVEFSKSRSAESPRGSSPFWKRSRRRPEDHRSRKLGRPICRERARFPHLVTVSSYRRACACSGERCRTSRRPR